MKTEVNLSINVGTLFLVVMIISAINSSELPDITTNLIEDDALDVWEAPEMIKKSYPYYLAGHDEDSRPIWIAEAGKWDVRKIVEEGGENFIKFDKYVNQIAQRFLKSIKNKSRPDSLVTDAIALDYNMWQLSSPKTVAYILKKTRELEPVARKVETGFVINTNYVAETMINLVRPILGRIMERVQIYGANKGKWIPRLRKRIPKSCPPEWYGGQKNFQPLRVYG